MREQLIGIIILVKEFSCRSSSSNANSQINSHAHLTHSPTSDTKNKNTSPDQSPMDPPIAAMASSPHEPEAEDPASLTSCINHLLLFDDLDLYDGGAAFLPPLEAASSGLSIPAHDALMAFLAEMKALEEEQQSNDGSNSTGSDTEAIEVTAATTADTKGTMEVAVKREAGEIQQRTLQAARARTDTCKISHTTAKSIDITPTNANSTGLPEKKKRIRAKQKIDMLREDAEALQHQLELLQSAAATQRKSQMQEGGDDNRATEAPLSTDAGTASKSKKPKLQHNGAVEQNRQLRKLVKSQLRYAKQIETMLMSKCPDKEERSILISDNVITKTPLSKADLVVFYEALTGKLDSLYAQLDDVFADADLHTSHQEFSDAKLVIDDKKYATLQLRDVKMLPFSFESVKDVSLRLLKAQCVREGDGVDELLVADEDVMLMRRGMVVQLEEGRPEVEVPTRVVSKKFLSKDRMVFCWEGTTDWPAPPQTAKDQPKSVPLREKGWAVIKPVPGASGLCTMQMCLLMTPGFSEERMLAMISRKDLEEGATKFIIPTYQQAFVSRYQMIENKLLDEQRER